MSWRKFKEGEKIQIKNLLQQDNLFWIIDKKLFIPPYLDLYMPLMRTFGAKGVILYAAEYKQFAAKGWYVIRSMAGRFMVAHETELLSLDRRWEKEEAAKIIKESEETSSVMERWLNQN